MPSEATVLLQTTQLLNREYLAHYPYQSARHIEAIDSDEAAELLESQPIEVVANLWRFIPAGTSDSVFSELKPEFATKLLKKLDSHIAVALLSRLSENQRDEIFSSLMVHDSGLVEEMTELLSYPDDTAARLMTSQVNAFYGDLEVEDAIRKLKHQRAMTEDVIYVLDQEQRLLGEISLAELIIAADKDTLLEIAKPIKTMLHALDSKDEVIEMFEGHRCSAIPVLDTHEQLVGMIRFFDIYQSTKEDLAADMQTMVGVSKEEKALSSSWFAVKKRMPWLQINLITAFAAAAVVGAFEGLIAEITALAILLPVAAGQSGNAGAQALAVTMRGLTLREITVRHWPKVMIKEMSTGIMNGVAIAITCSIAVYFWSKSIGLALVMALAMVASLSIACTAGAIVPIALKKFGMDPAQSSSIVLTTITDIAGFLSFLGIALLLSDMLPRG